MSKKVFLLFMFVLFITNITAQVTNDENAIVLKEISTYIDQDVNQGMQMRSASPMYSDSKNLESLVMNVQSSVYLKADSVNSYGEKPKRLFVDLNSINQIPNSQFMKDYIEIVVISIKNLNDLNVTLDMSLMSSLKKLKYVYFVSEVNISESTITNLISNSKDSYSFFYKIENKS